MQTWQRVNEPETTKIGWRYLVRKEFIDPAGKKQEYYTVSQLDDICIATIALTSQNRVIIAEQFRPGPERIFEEIPGGGHDEGEDIEEAARRELHEETGFVAESMEYLGKVYKDAYSNSTWHYFLARGCVKDSEQHTDDGEFIAVKEISVEQLFDNARSGKMTDPEAVFLAYEKLKELEGRHETTN